MRSSQPCQGNGAASASDLRPSQPMVPSVISEVKRSSPRALADIPDPAALASMYEAGELRGL